MRASIFSFIHDLFPPSFHWWLTASWWWWTTFCICALLKICKLSFQLQLIVPACSRPYPVKLKQGVPTKTPSFMHGMVQAATLHQPVSTLTPIPISHSQKETLFSFPSPSTHSSWNLQTCMPPSNTAPLGPSTCTSFFQAPGCTASV